MATRDLPLSSIMTKDLVIARPTDTVRMAAEIFRKNNFHHIPVLDEGGKLVGMFSKSDFNRVAYGFPPTDDGAIRHESLEIGEIMTRDLVCLHPSDPLSLAVSVLRENLFHSIPIVENGQLVGLVTTFDLLESVF